MCAMSATSTAPVTIDGYSQPGASANTLAVGDDAVAHHDGNVALDEDVGQVHARRFRRAIGCGAAMQDRGGFRCQDFLGFVQFRALQAFKARDLAQRETVEDLLRLDVP